jgi:hypothetical protein
LNRNLALWKLFFVNQSPHRNSFECIIRFCKSIMSLCHHWMIRWTFIQDMCQYRPLFSGIFSAVIVVSIIESSLEIDWCW